MKAAIETEISKFHQLDFELPDAVIVSGRTLLNRMNGEENGFDRGWIWYRIAIAQIIKVRYEAALRCLNEAMQVHQKNEDNISILKDKLALGLLYCRQEQSEQAFDIFMMIRDIARGEGIGDIEAAAACGMGKICTSQGRFQEAKGFLDSAVQLDGKTGRSFNKAAILHETGKWFLSQGSIADAVPKLEDAVTEAQLSHDPFLYDYKIVLADLYTSSRRYDESSLILSNTLDDCRKTGKRHGEMKALYYFGVLEAAKRRMESAQTSWEECFKLTEQLNERHYRILSGEKLVELHYKSGNADQALIYMHQIRHEERESRNQRLQQTISSYDQSMRIGDLEREMQAWRRRSGELEQIRDDREESIRELEIIKDIGQQITGTLEPDRIFAILHDRLSELITVDSLFISFYNEGSEEIDFRYVIENGKRLPPMVLPVRKNESLSTFVIKNDCDLIINDRSEQSFYTNRLLKVNGTRQNNESFLFVRLKTNILGKGVLSVQAQKKNRYKERHLKVLQAISGFVGVALFNAHSHQNLVIANKKIAHMATHDTLTGLPNRMQIIQHLEQALKRCERYKETLAVLFIDIDGFKDVNDGEGHRAGDALLVELADRLSSGVRATDYVGRLAGDEFLVILTDDCTISDGLMLAENLRQKLAEPYEFNGKQLRVSASIGLALYPDDGRNPEGLVNAADASMYDAKTSGKNRVAHR